MKLIFSKRVLLTIVCILLGVGFFGVSAVAQTENRAANIKSKGIFDYQDGTVILDASDLTYLANEIDLLEDIYKAETVDALNQLGTYYRADGTLTHDSTESVLLPDHANLLDFGTIKNGILFSQSIPTEKTFEGTLPGNKETVSGNINAASAGNLSLGEAAWVDGELIIGTGEDNLSYYAKGITDGRIGYYTQAQYDANYKTGYNKGITDGRVGYYTQAQYDANYESGYSKGVTDGRVGYYTQAQYEANYNSGYSAGQSNPSIKTGTYTWTWSGNKFSDNYLDLTDTSLSFSSGKSNLIAAVITEISGVYFYGYNSNVNSNEYVLGGLLTSVDTSGNVYLTIPGEIRITNFYDTGTEDYGTASITITYYYY